MEEVAKEAYIGGSDEAQEGEDERVDGDHSSILFLGVCWLWLGAWSVTLDTRFKAGPKLVLRARSAVQCSVREEK